jgi:uncharacterized lipoprotein YddW (UPF0748 family)
MMLSGGALRRLIAVCVLLPLCLIAGAAVDAAQRFSVAAASLDSADAVRRAISSAAASSADTIVVTLSPYATSDLPFDGLAALIRGAHDRGLRVQAAVTTNLVTGIDELPASREHVLYQHPEWLMVPREIAPELLRIDLRSPGYLGRLARWARANASKVTGIYLSPLSPAATEYAARATEELVRRYAFDGIELRAVPCADDFDFSRTAMDLFRAEVRSRLTAAERTRMDGIEAIDPFAYANEHPDDWQLFQRSRLETFVDRASAAVRAARPSILLAADETTTPAAAH